MIEVARIRSYIGTGSVPPTRVLARIATRQHGVISRGQIFALGLGRSFVREGIRSGRLHQLHLGVYAVGHERLTQESHWLAAVLACGESSLLSHRSAAALWRIAFLELGRVDILIPGRGSRFRPGLAIRRTRNLPDADRTEIDGIPVTTLNRTLLDLAAIATESQLRKAVAEAARQELLDTPSLVALCDDRSGCRGTGALARIAQEQRGPISATRSPPETDFLAVCIRRGFPTPAVNAPLAGWEPDFLWPASRLVVEVDSRGYHRSWSEQERDRAKDAAFQEAGYNVLRYSQETLDVHEEATFAQIGRFLFP
jgi:hypothetical protein